MYVLRACLYSTRVRGLQWARTYSARETLRELAHGRRTPLVLPVLARFPSVVDVGDDFPRPPARFLEGQGAVAADLEAGDFSLAMGLRHIALSAIGIDPDAEPFDLVVPDEIFLLSGGQGIDVAFCQMGHGPAVRNLFGIFRIASAAYS